eukprot:1159067-Pelagomonas_calceolata.AAC.11
MASKLSHHAIQNLRAITNTRHALHFQGTGGGGYWAHGLLGVAFWLVLNCLFLPLGLNFVVGGHAVFKPTCLLFLN